MPVYCTYKSGNLVVGVWKLDETVEELRSMIHQFPMYEEGFNRLKAEKRQREWLAIRVLLRELCGEEKAVAYYPSGKPYLDDGSAFVSFSHTNGYVAVALHPFSEVGVDIEQYATRVKRVASKFIRDDEQVSIDNGDEIYALLLHWSAKETIYKLMEEEAVDFIDHLHIFPFLFQERGTFNACEYRSGKGQRYLIHYETHPDYVLTFACME